MDQQTRPYQEADVRPRAAHSLSQDDPSKLQEQQSKQTKPAMPFLYNMRVLPTALPGMLFVIAMSGELLLGILTMGALIIYLMVAGGAARNAVVAYVCTFVAAQLSVLYSCLPLVWISLFNIPLLMLLNMFLGLTGGWGLVQLDFLVQDQPLLARAIEAGLFTLYPLASVGLVTWLTGYLVSVRFAVYVGIIYGFLLLRTSLKPTRSSFTRLHTPETGSNLILGNPEVAAVLIVYLGFPSGVYLISNLMVFLQGDFTPLLELLLFALLPAFLTTFIQLRGLYKQCNITVAQVSQIRTGLGLAVLALTCWVLHQSQLSAATTWLIPAVFCYTLLGFSLSRESRARPFSTFFAVCATLVTAFIVTQVVPTDISLPLASPYLVTFILIINVAVSTVCASALGHSKKNSSFFPNCFILHSVLLVHTECFFMSRGFYSPFLAAFTTLLETYLLARLRSTSKATRDCQWLSCSMHAIKLPLLIVLLLNISSNVIRFQLLSCYSSVALAMVILKVLYFEEKVDLQVANVVAYLLCVAAGLFVFLVNVVRPVLLQFVSRVGLTQIILCDLFITCLVSCKLTRCNMQQYKNSFLVSRVCLFFSGVSLVLQAPAVQAFVSPWLVLMLECALVLHLLCTCSLIKVPNPKLYSLIGGTLVGIPLGMTYCQVFGLVPSTLLFTIYVLLSVVTLTLLMLLWRYSIEWKSKNLVLCTKDPLVHGSFAVFVAITLVLLVRDVALLSTTVPLWIALTSSPATVFCCLLSGTLCVGFHVLCLKWQQEDPFAYKPGLLPTYGNTLTIGAYLLAVLSNPLPFPEIWNSACSIVLLCLQQDQRLLPDFRASTRTGVIFAVCSLQLLIFSLKHSMLWSLWELSFFAILELLVLPLSVPSLIVMATFLSRQPKYALPEHTVIMWAPVPIVIFIFGDSYTSWLLAGTSFASGLWLLQQTSFGLQI